jgi:hypothetical protein
VAFLPQALSYLALNGRVGPSQVTSRKMSWTSPHAWDVLTSPAHGFLMWTPLALFALAGLAVLIVRSASPMRDVSGQEDRGGLIRLAAAFAVMVAAQVYVVGAVESWTLAGAFGQRRFVSLTPLMIVGLAVLFATVRGRTWRGALAAAIVLAVWWNVALVVQFGAGLMNRQRLELRHNAYNTFVTVPRLLPDIARRYLFDRGSFYHQAAPAPDRGPR